MSVAITAESTYFIICQKTGTVVDFSQSDLKSIIGYLPLHEGTNQQWKLENAGSGLFYIRSGKGAYISWEGDAKSNIRLIANTSSKQAWKIIPHESDSSLVRILHPTLKLSMDMTVYLGGGGTQVYLYDYHGGTNQAWKLKLASGPPALFDPNRAPAFYLTNFYTKTLADSKTPTITGQNKTKESTQIWFTESIDANKNTYSIKSAETGKYLSIKGSPFAAQPIELSDTPQAWEIRPEGNDPSRIWILLPGTDWAIDLTASDSRPDTKVILYPKQKPGLNQQWLIEAAV